MFYCIVERITVSWTKHCAALSPSQHSSIFTAHHTELWSGMYSSLMFWQVLSLLSIHQRRCSVMDSIPFVWRRSTSCSLKRCLCHRNTSSIYLCALSPTCIRRHWTMPKGSWRREMEGQILRPKSCTFRLCIPLDTDEEWGFFFGMRV